MHVNYEISIENLPRECVSDIFQPGSADDAVEYWRKELSFTVNRERAIQCLEAYGLGDDEDSIASWSDDRLASYVLWLAASDFGEYLVNPDCGSDIFVLEG